MRLKHVHQSHYPYRKRTSALAMWAALVTGALLAIGHTPESAHGQAAKYEPYVLVDICEFIDEEESMTVTLGEARDVNDDGLVVGWYEDTSGDTQPFVLDPGDGGSLMDVNNGDFEEAWMEAINSPSNGGVKIVGWAKDHDVQDHPEEPVLWTWDSENSEWVIDTIYNNGTLGAANDVSDTGFITGYFLDANDDKHVFYGTGASNPADWGLGEGFDIYQSSVVCGDAENPNKSNQLQGFVQWGSDDEDDRQYLVGDDPFDEYSHARAINDDGDIVGDEHVQSLGVALRG